MASAAHNVEVDGSIEERIHYSDAKRQDVERSKLFTVCWDLSHSRRLIAFHWPEGVSYKPYLFAENDKYAFELDGPLKAGAYRLDHGRMHSGISGRNANDRINANLRSFNWYLEAGCRIWGVPLIELIGDDQFRMIGAEYIGDANDETSHVRVEFQYLGKSPGDFRFPEGRYWAELDPEYFWQVRRCGVDGPTWDYVCEISFQVTTDGLPFPKHVEMIRRSKKTGGYDADLIRFGAPRECRRPAEEFYLTHYGIPESVLDVREPSQLHRILLINIASIILIIAILVFLRLRRSSKLEPKST